MPDGFSFVLPWGSSLVRDFAKGSKPPALTLRPVTPYKGHLPSVMDTLLSLLKWMVLVFLVIFLRPTIDKLIRAGESPDNPVLAASLSSRTAVQLQGYKTLLMAHYAAEGRLPEDLQAWLRAEFLMPDGKDPALDAWGRPLEPATIDGANGIRSRGPDGRPGTSDDVVLLIGGGQQHP